MPRYGSQDGEALRRDLNAVLSKELSRCVVHVSIYQILDRFQYLIDFGHRPEHRLHCTRLYFTRPPTIVKSTWVFRI